MSNGQQWTSNEEHTLEAEIEEFLASQFHDIDSLCIQEYKDQCFEEIYDIKITGNQGNKLDYIDVWFQSVISIQHRSIFQQLWAPCLQEELVSYPNIR